MNNVTHRLIAVSLALGLPASVASAKSVDEKTAWGAAAAVAGVAAVLEAKDNPLTAAALAAGAVYSYTQYDKARRDDRDDRYRYDDRGYGDSRYDSDPYGYTRPGAIGSARYNGRTREVTGIVTRDTGVFDRDIRVRLDDGRERTVKVPKDARVLRDGRTISVHDLKKNDRVRVRLDRFRADGDLDANRVDVLGRVDEYRYDDRYNDRYDDRDWDDRYSRNETRGVVDSIDSRNGILRIRVNGRVERVDVRRAEIRDRRGSLPLRDLQDGDRVTVTGSRDGDTIRATRVAVG